MRFPRRSNRRNPVRRSDRLARMLSMQNFLPVIGYAVYRTSAFLARLIPLSVLFLVGKLLGRLAALVLRRRCRLAAANIGGALGVGEVTARGMACEHFAILGANLFAMLKIPSMTDAQIWRHVTFEIAPEVQTEGKGWVAVLAHMSNWELLARLARLFPQFRFGAVYQKLVNARVDAHFNRSRAALGITLFDRKEGFWKAVAFLESGGVVGVLADQFAGDSGTWMPFFGRLTSTTTLPAALAQRVGVELVPISVTTTGLARWRVVVGHPLPAADTPETATAIINRELERQITASPTDWLWAHDRWKTPRFGFLLSAGSRKMSFPRNFSMSTLVSYRILIRSVVDLEEAQITVAAVQAIKRGRPDARVTMVSPEALVGFWLGVEEVDAVISFADSESVWQVAKKISQAGPFEVGLLLPPDVRGGREMFLAGVPYRLGPPGRFPWSSWKNPPGRPEPEATGEKRYRRILSAAGAEWK